MPVMTARRWVLVLFGVVIVGLVVLDVAVRARTTHPHHHRAAPTTQPLPPTPTSQALGNPTVCATVAATNTLADAHHTTYLAIISSSSPQDRTRYGVGLAAAYNPHASYGPYGPVIAYLVNRYLHPDAAGAPTVDVVDSASALDTLRTSHQCDHLPVP